MNRKLFVISLIILMCTPLFFTMTVAASKTECIWVIIDQLALDELVAIKTKNIDYLQKKGAFGVMNVRQGDGYHPGSTYLSIGAGNRSVGSKFSHEGKEINKKIVNPNINSLKIKNKNNIYHSEPGLLGESLKKAGEQIAVLGNCDTIWRKKRTIVSLAMDQEGYVPLGTIDNTLLKNEIKPWGYETNWQNMKDEFRKYNNKADFLVIETGDITRINDYYYNFLGYKRKNLSPNRPFFQAKREAVKEIDNFIGYLLDNIDLKQTQLGIIVPTPSPEQIKKGNKLSWTLLAGKGIQSGWLTSQSTTRQGIITISDLLPTLLILYVIKYHNLSGKPVNVVQASPEWQDIIRLNNKIYLTSNLRLIFVKGFIFFQLSLILLAVVKIWYAPVILNRIYEYILLGLLLIPINFMLISTYNPPGLLIYLVFLLFLTGFEIYLLRKYFNNPLKRIIVITSTLILMIIIDLFTGYNLMADSLLGYSSLVGARYYGVGNEYMGLFIGAGLISITGIFELGWGNSYLKWVFLVFLFSMTVFIGYPGLGANFGGTITVITATLFSLYYLDRDIISIKLLLVVLGIFVLILYLDYSGILGKNSHIGRAIQKLIEGDFKTIGEIISRKVMINLKLLRWTIWTKVLLAFLVCIIVVFRHPVGKLEKLFKDYPYLASGFYGGVAGSVITFFVNDSGVVATATLLFYPIMVLLYIIEEYGYN